MRKFALVLLVFSFVACKQQKWDKQTLTNDCLKEFNEKNEQQKLFTTLQIANLCDCMSDKMLARYKSVAESNKDKEGGTQIGKECALEVMTGE